MTRSSRNFANTSHWRSLWWQHPVCTVPIYIQESTADSFSIDWTNESIESGQKIDEDTVNYSFNIYLKVKKINLDRRFYCFNINLTQQESLLNLILTLFQYCLNTLSCIFEIHSLNSFNSSIKMSNLNTSVAWFRMCDSDSLKSWILSHKAVHADVGCRHSNALHAQCLMLQVNGTQLMTKQWSETQNS